MSNQRAKTGVTVVSVSRKDIHSDIRKKHRREKLSIKQKIDEVRSESIPFDQYESKTYSPTVIHSSMLEKQEISSTNETNINHPRVVSSIIDQNHPVSVTSSFNKSFTFFENADTSSVLSGIKSIEDYREQKPNRRSRRYTNAVIEREIKKPSKNIENNQTDKKNRRRRRLCKLCPAYSNCCCVSTIIGILLALFGITALLVFIFTSKHVTTTTTSTTSTTSTSTSTSSTTSTTSVTTSTTTPTPPCTPTSVGSASTLYSTSSGSATSYTCFAYEWTSPTTGLVTLAFELRHDPHYWFLDDVSVYAGAVQMLTNTGFETGSLSPWVRTTPYGSCSGSAGQICSGSYSPHSGNDHLCDGSNGCADRISQQFMATAGEVYVVSFWLKSGSTGSTISAKVTLS
ncbi:unnamed protein product [Rotaria sp. Silwood1]|nr:unnamed protein product [Rotaria sp. Silwood1]CAF4915108.1 unnamed protein product [Rotaria sp. Silwood1]